MPQITAALAMKIDEAGSGTDTIEEENPSRKPPANGGPCIPTAKSMIP